MLHRVICCWLVWVGLSVTAVQAQTWQQATEYDRLLAEYGLVATGAGIPVSQVEALSGGNYLPDVNNPALVGKTFTVLSGPSGISTHATGVARNFVGSLNVGTPTSVSMAPGVTTIFNYEANNWIDNVLNWVNVSNGNGLEPLSQSSFVVQNHSWIGTAANPTQANATNILQRVDYVINRDNVTMVVGVNNGNNLLPQMLSHAYNVISVGQNLPLDHSPGPTRFYGAGRVKPDIVAFSGSTTASTTTSISTARVSSAAAMLHELAVGTNAAQSETMKAILLAGATKTEFPDWDRTTTRPLDEFYGAGELNIYNSYQILTGGEFEGSTLPPASGVGERGWDFSTAQAGSPVFYDIDLRGTGGANQLSALLTWNIDVLDTDATALFVPATVLANMDLQLFDSTGSFLGSLVDASLSTVDNVEHIYLPNLAAGLYTLQVSTNLTHDFALAWRFNTLAVPEPAGWLIAGVAGLLVSFVRRRR